ncbi:MAG: hypothetical protein ACPHXR_05320 [Flavicella sp.]
MKNIIKKGSYLVMSLAILASCNDDENPLDIISTGGQTVLKTKSVTSFDINNTIELEYFLGNGVTVESVYLDAQEEANKITSTDNTAEFNISKLESIDDSFNVITNLSNGVTIQDDYSISIGAPVSVGSAEYTVVEAVDSKEAIIVTNNTLSATIDETQVRWKIGAEGEFQVGGELDIESSEKKMDSIDLRTIDLTDAPYNMMVNDTLHMEFISKSGTLMDTIKSSVVYITQSFVASTNSVTFDAETTEFHFLGSEDEEADITYDAAADEITISNSKIEVVKADEMTDEEFTTLTSDFVQVYNLFNEGSTLSKIEGPMNGEVYIFKVMRMVDGEEEEKAFYGFIKIGDKISTEVITNGETTTTNTLEVTVMEGSGTAPDSE